MNIPTQEICKPRAKSNVFHCAAEAKELKCPRSEEVLNAHSNFEDLESLGISKIWAMNLCAYTHACTFCLFVYL